MSQSQTFGSYDRTTGPSKAQPGFKLDAHTLNKLKDQALRKAKLLQAKVGACPPPSQISPMKPLQPLLLFALGLSGIFMTLLLVVGCQDNIRESRQGRPGRTRHCQL